MNDSNWTLRWNRSSRDAFGHDVSFKDETHWGDRIVGILALIALGIVIGRWI